MSEPSRRANRLLHETSPYLLQHAYNPVDWFPWGEEALRISREQNKPIFLSIGYSACHWCHVMEHESFENAEIAKLMNEHFVCIKVDREERPDLDQIYMMSVQIMTGSGGWPMSVFLLPNLKPFFGGTYWPPEARADMRKPGFREILLAVHDAWMHRQDALEEQAAELTESVVKSIGLTAEIKELDAAMFDKVELGLVRFADKINGGFGDTPKFPHPMDLRVLLRTWRRFGHDDALQIVRLTLDKMANGGIYDQLGGGFHRYSTDARWLVPHFEKMLYDNALLTSTYLEAFQATGESTYARVVDETLGYIMREMTQPVGGFYSTQDADSEGEEGKFFVWTAAEVLRVIGPENARVFNSCYDVTPGGNWEGHTILNRPRSMADCARLFDTTPEAQEEILARCRHLLFEERSQRVAPGRDDKVLVSWNGLMIAALAQASLVLNEPTYALVARNAALFILDEMRTPEGRLLHCFKDGRARFNGYLDDYACFIDGLVELYQATSEARYLQEALSLADMMISQFWDQDEGGFFYTSNDHETLIARTKDVQDSATPSGNGMAAAALLKLGRLASRTDLEGRAVELLKLLSGQFGRSTIASSQALIALDFYLGPAHELVFVDGTNKADSETAWHSIQQSFMPGKVVLRLRADTDALQVPLFRGKTAVNGEPTLYPCQHGNCQLPIVGLAAIQAWQPKAKADWQLQEEHRRLRVLRHRSSAFALRDSK